MSASVHHLEPPPLDLDQEIEAIDARLARLAGAPPPSSAQPVGWSVEQIIERFALDAFERRALLFAAAAELRATTRDLVAQVGAGPPSIGLLMRVCADELEEPRTAWRALRPDGALRQALLLATGEHGRFTERPVWVEEPVIHAFHGQVQLDEELAGLALPLPSDIAQDASEAAVDRVIDGMGHTDQTLLELVCDDPGSALGVATAAFARAGLGTVALPLGGLPRDPTRLGRLRRAWLRDALIHQLGLVLVGDGDSATAPLELVSGWGTPVHTVGLGLPPTACGGRVAVETTQQSHAAIWRTALRDPEAQGMADRLAHTFRLPATTIHTIGLSSRSTEEVWAAARAAARPRDDSLAERIDPRARLAEVIVPEQVAETLADIVHAGRGHHRVARAWADDRGARGLGITALFSGPSGTGKTMAAEAIATELGLDLYRVELSAVVSKYIGETERNLRRVFTETLGGVLLFDEADALFGKRSEVRDAHDHYANIEVGYLLQQMESYGGIALLTTNMPDAIDSAFVRRLRFIARFTMPGAAERRRIWEGAFPAGVDREQLDFATLAKLSLTGGVIHNIALGATFRAVGSNRRVTIADVVAATRTELIKLGQPLTEVDGRHWS